MNGKRTFAAHFFEIRNSNFMCHMNLLYIIQYKAFGLRKKLVVRWHNLDATGPTTVSLYSNTGYCTLSTVENREVEFATCFSHNSKFRKLKIRFHPTTD
jgi:hypothetical protein